MKTLRFILGDQLNYKHSWFDHIDENTIFFIAETLEETGYVNHHIQKIIGFFMSMRSLADHLKNEGHQVIYYKIDDDQNQHNLEDNLNQIITNENIQKFEYQYPDEYRLDQKLKNFCDELNIETQAFDTEHFYTSREDVAEFFKGKKTMVMEYFYRNMRKKYDILMESDKQPEGGDWNFDKSNRKVWKGQHEIPEAKTFSHDVSEIYEVICNKDITFIGRIQPKSFEWPINREECLEVLNYFCNHLLIHFGDYEDAMHTEQKMLFHSRLSFAMNTKMLSPKEIINKAIETYYNRKDEIDISEIEGFVRQILGWREYMRGIYWKEMPKYEKLNTLENTNKLPDFYWTGKTKMNCMSHAINQSLDHAYAHHIQRLMITGNFALLNMTNPDEVDAWYLGVYMDAIQWVELTNTRGMSQFADGGIVATKPYVSSGSYINKMSNYCKSCHYKVSKKEGEDACPFNNLYWNFLHKKKAYFKDNPRMNMMLSVLNKMNKDTLEYHIKRAEDIIENPEKY
ncbi:cryptochrome/photolyase family protein [Flavobacteriaceae bacterium 14752]|uniref:cryptochrome/photolyase family protein n=1 Tax=Mesohalobacter salilacus TaxID=2491711 RepID=UPI000F63AF8A|nr:cryptochrome/photolyase family protein [Flavobacteriaceae bacterium 14752]